jgi:hypothetical protein
MAVDTTIHDENLGSDTTPPRAAGSDTTARAAKQ